MTPEHPFNLQVLQPLTLRAETCRVRTLLLGSLAASALLVAVTTTASALAGGHPSAAKPEACPSIRAAAMLPRWRDGGVVRADVVGDGYRGVASVRYAPGASNDCGFMLFVKTRAGALATRVAHVGEDFSRPFPIGEWPEREPVILGAVALGDGRSQIAVASFAAGDGVDVDLYGVAAGKLRLLQTAPKPSFEPWFFGGTAGAQSLPSCRRGGPLLLLGVWNVDQSGGPRWGFEETSYHLGADGRFRQTGSRREFGTVTQMWAKARREGWTGTPFGSCTLARAVHH
jgi:hypothetical protein